MFFNNSSVSQSVIASDQWMLISTLAQEFGYTIWKYDLNKQNKNSLCRAEVEMFAEVVWGRSMFGNSLVCWIVITCCHVKSFQN